MKILLIGSKKSFESRQLRKEAEKRNHYLEIIPLNKIALGIQKNFIIFTEKNKDVSEFDAVIFRAINRHITEAKIIAKYMQDKNKIIIDEILAKNGYDFHKFLMHIKLKNKNIPQPATYLPLGFNGLKKILEKIKPPLVVKHLKKTRGRDVFRFNAQKEVLDFFSQNKKQRPDRYLIQEWYPARSYYRVLVLGGKVLGAMERISLLRENKPKIPLAERSKKTVLTEELKKISLLAARAAGIEFGGLDIMLDKGGRLKVLEINRSPKFQRFSQITGINVAEKVIRRIENKFK